MKKKKIFWAVFGVLLILCIGVTCIFIFKNNTKVKGIATSVLPTLASNKSGSGLYMVTHPKDTTLQIGNNKDIIEYRYRGKEPKNYVTFNNEIWRIIGVFPTDDGTGKIENRIKLIRNETLNQTVWNGCSSYKADNYFLTVCDDPNGIKNNFNISMIKEYLNTTYYNTLINESKNMIDNAKYYLGGYDGWVNEQGYTQTSVQMYSYERKIQNTTSNEFYYGSNPNNWVGKLGLMYASDYGYASGNCENKRIYDIKSSSNDIRACNDTNWLYINSDEWLLNQNSEDVSFVYSIGESGSVFSKEAPILIPLKYRPVLYLKSNVKIISGSGKINDMYILGM